MEVEVTEKGEPFTVENGGSGDQGRQDEGLGDEEQPQKDLVPIRNDGTAIQSSDYGFEFSDHFTLRIPSSDVRYRGNLVHVYDLRAAQIQLVPQFVALGESNDCNDNGNRHQEKQRMIVELRHIPNDRGGGLSALRLLYSLMAVFFVGILFVFCFQVLLFLFMDLVVDSGLLDYYEGAPQASWYRFLGTSAAVPVFLYGLSAILAVASFFVSDIWQGHLVLKVVGNVSNVTIEWMTLLINLGIPTFVMTVSLFAGSDIWWELSMYTWFACMATYFVLFAFIVLYYEIEAAWLIAKEIDKKKGNREIGGRMAAVLHFVRLSIRHRQNSTWSGVYHKVRVTGGEMNTNDDMMALSNAQEFSLIEHDNAKGARDKHTSTMSLVLEPSEQFCTRWYTRMTQSKKYGCSSLFEKVDPPARLYTTEELFSKRQFKTRHNWSLEQLLCTNRKERTVTIIRGPVALEREQVISSAICVILSITGIALLVVAALVWAGTGTTSITAMLLVILCTCYPRISSLRRFVEAYRSSLTKEDQTITTRTSRSQPPNDADDGIYQTFEEYRVSQPTTTFRFILFVLHIGILYIFPTVVLMTIQNWPLVAFFIIIEIWTALRYWLDPSVLLKDLGSFDAVVGQRINDNHDKNDIHDKNKRWSVRSRISTIVLNVTRSPARSIWMWILIFMIFGILALTIGSITYFNDDSVQGGIDEVDDDLYDVSNTTGVNGLFWGPIRLTPRGNFEYPPQDNLQYPTCRLFKGFEFPGGGSTGLADYALLAAMIYQAPETLQGTLDEWFGPGKATVEHNITRDFRQTVAGGSAAVNYQVISFDLENDRNAAVVVVRGSTTSWEWLTNGQLWGAVAVVQIIREFLPAGKAFNPILDGVLRAMSFVESSQLEQVALYRQTTALIDYLKQEQGFAATGNPIHITGQSLGGGIALISGAQAKIPAVAISGPNNLFSRQTFDPPLDLDVINSMLFNVIPERDIVPLVDKPGLLTQHIACRAEKSDLFGCHTSTRTLCEILYKCGSYNRPPPCECAVKYGYPEANQITGNETFTDICGSKRSNDGWFA